VSYYAPPDACDKVIGRGLGAGEAPVHGPEGFKVFLRNMRGALPDVHIAIEDTLAQGAKFAVRLVLEGTHTGGGLGIPPTGRKLRIAGIVIAQFVDGQIFRGWNSWDQLGLLQQLDAVPANER
jgi:predicted ester cyclase